MMQLFDATGPLGPVALGLAAAAFGAGFLNAIAGGGTFLTLPALVFAGLPPIVANATSAVAVAPGYIGGALGFRQELARVDRRHLLRMTAVTLVGGVAGSALLLITPEKAFSAIVPWLLLFATVLFAITAKPRPRRADAPSHTAPAPNVKPAASGSPWQLFALGAVAVYGGYFNGGLGILLMAVLAMAQAGSLATVNGLKNHLSALLSAISVAVFAAAGVIAWPAALWMMGFAMLGGYVGARTARRLPAPLVYAAVVLIGLGMSALFFARL